ncbi:hypothetical protein BS17DRAFT_704037, partial [Gyrodon lividus]
IGLWNFGVTSLDNTGNTWKACKILCQCFPHILNMQDTCHRLNLGIKAACLLPQFTEIISQLHRILVFMSQSTYVTEHYNHEHSKIGITHGLEAIGDTRFETIYWAGKSVQRGLAAFQAIVENKALGIDIASLNDLFIPGGIRMKFELDLARLLTVIGPYVKAIQCLEEGHVTHRRVYPIMPHKPNKCNHS